MPLTRNPATLFDELGITEPTDIDVEAIAQYCGATVLYEPLHGCEARIVGLSDRAIITVRDDASATRKRFSVAHELGHWLRDRAKIAFNCTERIFRREWGLDNPEQRANRFAADLLLPEAMFRPKARPLPVTLGTARSLADIFNTSLTATAIRLVELGPQPAMLVCSARDGERLWFCRHPDVTLWPHRTLGRDTVALEIAKGAPAAGPKEVAAATWIDHDDAGNYTLIEDSVPLGSDLLLSLLWWKDESQLISAAGLDDE
jgi:IrrE N-terminal-like domain